ncbi:MAG: hypothetical protein PHE15_02945, partial [Dehalococcoidales bacterium]|nr:hypothetical protein [Dehalococcoidales bacterium]
SLSTAMICSSVYCLAFTRILLGFLLYRRTLSQDDTVFRGKVNMTIDFKELDKKKVVLADHNGVEGFCKLMDLCVRVIANYKK